MEKCNIRGCGHIGCKKDHNKKDEIVSKKSNIWFGCEDCRQEWNQDDQPKDSVFYCGEACPNCQSKKIVVI